MIIAKLINLCFQQARQSQRSLSLVLQTVHIQIRPRVHIKRENIAENVLIKEKKAVCATNKRKINCTINMYNKYGVGAFAL